MKLRPAFGKHRAVIRVLNSYSTLVVSLNILIQAFNAQSHHLKKKTFSLLNKNLVRILIPKKKKESSYLSSKYATHQLP